VPARVPLSVTSLVAVIGQRRKAIIDGSLLLLPVFAATVYVLLAYSASPWVLPGLIGLGAAVVVSVNRPEIGVAIGIVLVPLGNLEILTVPGAPGWTVGPLWALFLFSMALWRIQSDGWHRPPLAMTVAAYTLAVALSFLFSDSPRAAGWTFRALIPGLMLFIAITTFTRRRSDLNWVLAGLAGASTVVGLAALREWKSPAGSAEAFVTSSGELVNRAAAGFEHPNWLGGFEVLVIPLLLAAVLARTRPRSLAIAGLVLGLVGLYVSFSRASLVGAVLGATFFLRGRRAMLIVPLAFVVLLAGSPTLLKERFQTLEQSGSELSTRQDFWNAAEVIWSEHPLIGTGPGTFPEEYAKARIAGKEFIPNRIFLPPPHAHNAFLATLSEEGIIGLAALMALLVLAVRGALWLRHMEDRWLSLLGTGFLAALTGWAVHNCFDFTLLHSVGIYFWVVVGLLSATLWIAREEQLTASAETARHG
jgi:O-antigen ligase